MNDQSKSSQGNKTPKGKKRTPAQPAGETEWLRVMLEEISRKQAELEEERTEKRRRDLSGE